MNSIDPGSLLLQLGQAQQGQPTAAISDQQILQLAARKSAQSSAPAAAVKPDTPFASWASWMPKPLQQFTAGAESAAPYYYDQARKSLGLSQNPGREAAEAQAQQPLAGKIGDWVGTGLLGLPIAAGAALAAPEAGLGALGAGAVGAIGGGAAQGALLSPAGHRIENALLGGLTGGLLHGAGALGGKVINGLARTPFAQALLDRNIPVTPGQMQPAGFLSRVEQALEGTPLGGKVAAARAAGPAAYARKMVSDALAPGDTLATGDLNAQIASGQEGFDRAYGNALNGYDRISPTIMRVKGGNLPLSDAFDQLTAKPPAGLSDREAARLGEQLHEQLQTTIRDAKRGGGMSASDLQTLRSRLRELKRQPIGEGSTADATREFWDEAQNRVTEAIESQLNPKDAAALRAIDAQYAKFQTPGNAAVAAGDRPGGPTLEQWQNAIKKTTPKPIYKTGGGYNRDLSKAARETFSSTIPRTGFAGQGLVAPLMHLGELGGAYALGEHKHPYAALGLLGLAGGVHGAYSPLGLRAFAGQTAPQRALQGLLGNLSPQMRKLLPLILRAGGTQAALQGLNGGGLLSAQPSQ